MGILHTPDFQSDPELAEGEGSLPLRNTANAIGWPSELLLLFLKNIGRIEIPRFARDK